MYETITLVLTACILFSPLIFLVLLIWALIEEARWDRAREKERMTPRKYPHQKAVDELGGNYEQACSRMRGLVSIWYCYTYRYQGRLWKDREFWKARRDTQALLWEIDKLNIETAARRKALEAARADYRQRRHTTIEAVALMGAYNRRYNN